MKHERKLERDNREFLTVVEKLQPSSTGIRREAHLAAKKSKGETDITLTLDSPRNNHSDDRESGVKKEGEKKGIIGSKVDRSGLFNEIIVGADW